MNEREDVLNNNQKPQPTSSISPNTPIVSKVDSGAVFMDKLPSRKPKFHWSKTTLKAVGKSGKMIVFKSGGGETLYVSMALSKGSDTYRNLFAVLKNQTAGPLHVQWSVSEDGRKFIKRVLDDVQYQAALKDMNGHRKMMNAGFRDQNMFMS